MTVQIGKGGGAKPKPKVHVPVGNKGPRGTAPVYQPPPKPAPVYHAAPASTKTGGNPRGVSIPKHAPKPTKNDKQAKFLGTGANPRGVRIKGPKPPTFHGLGGSAGAKVKISKSSGGGGGLLGVIENPTAAIAHIAPGALHVVTHIPSEIAHIASSPIVHNTFKDIRDIVPASIEGLGTIAAAAGHDLVSEVGGPLLHVGPGAASAPSTHSDLEKLAVQSWKGSVIKPLLEGHIGQAAKRFVAHPLYGTLEFTGALGAAGRIAGIAGRSGLLGQIGKDVASTAREDRFLGDGQRGLKRHYHPNLIVKGGQKLLERPRPTLIGMDEHGGAVFSERKPGPIEREIRKTYRNKRVDYTAGTTKAVHAGHRHELIKDMGNAIRGDEHRFKITKDRRAAAHVASYVTQGIVDRGAMLDELRGLRTQIQDALDTKQMARAAKREASKHVKNIDAFLKHPDVKAVGEIADRYAERGGKLTAEMVQHHLLTDNEAALAPKKPYVAAGKMPGTKILTADDVASILRYVKDDAHMKQLDARDALHSDDKAVRTRGIQEMDQAHAEIAQADQLHKGDVVTHDPTSPFGLRKVGADEIAQHMMEHGVDPGKISHVELVPPGEASESGFINRNQIGRGDTKIKTRTGEGIMTGNWKAGHTALADSQLHTIGRIDRAKAADRFIREHAFHDSAGKVLEGSKEQMQQYREAYEAEHDGEHLSILPTRSAGKGAGAANDIRSMQSWLGEDGKRVDPEAFASENPGHRFTVAHRHVVERFEKHLEQDSKPPNFANKLTRQFRNTVLPFSPKWLTGNVVEAALRSAVAGHTPRDAIFARKVIKAARDSGDTDTADELKAAAGGLHYDMAHSANEQAIEAGALRHPDPGMLRRAVEASRIPAAAHKYSQLVQAITHGNSVIEARFAEAALGAHMMRQAREFGATWEQAAAHQEAWIQKLAQGYADPELARDAVSYIHKTLGQYNHFSPKAKFIVNNIAPFAPWYWNALRFVYYTMPATHPVVQSVLLAAANSVQASWAKQAKDLADLGSTFGGHKYSSLFSDLKTGPNSYLDIGRYTPWGAFANGPQDFVGSQVFPQGQGPLLAFFANQDPFGRTLKDKHGDVTDQFTGLQVALNEVATSILGPVNPAFRVLAEHGSTPYSASTMWNNQLKPNTHHGPPGILGGVERVFSPAYPTHLSANPTGGSSGNEGTFSGGGSSTFSGGGSSTFSGGGSNTFSGGGDSTFGSGSGKPKKGGVAYRGESTKAQFASVRVGGGAAGPLFDREGDYKAAYAFNKRYAKPGPYLTKLSPADERRFRAWVTKYHVPFDPNAKVADYDMRGYWKANPSAQHSAGQHFPDTYKTPYDTTFSRQSKYSLKSNPDNWRGNDLVNTRTGKIIFAPPTTEQAV